MLIRTYSLDAEHSCPGLKSASADVFIGLGLKTSSAGSARRATDLVMVSTVGDCISFPNCQLSASHGWWPKKTQPTNFCCCRCAVTGAQNQSFEPQYAVSIKSLYTGMEAFGGISLPCCQLSPSQIDKTKWLKETQLTTCCCCRCTITGAQNQSFKPQYAASS